MSDDLPGTTPEKERQM